MVSKEVSSPGLQLPSQLVPRGVLRITLTSTLPRSPVLFVPCFPSGHIVKNSYVCALSDL